MKFRRGGEIVVMVCGREGVLIVDVALGWNWLVVRLVELVVGLIVGPAVVKKRMKPMAERIADDLARWRCLDQFPTRFRGKRSLFQERHVERCAIDISNATPA